MREGAEVGDRRHHMSSEEFRRHGRQIVDWIADYWECVETLPVLAQVEPGAVRAKLPQEPPVEGRPFDELMALLDDVVVPGLTHWQSPNFFAFFPANVSGPSVLGELLAAGLGTQGMLWATSPSCTELESHVMDWMTRMLGLPDDFRASSSGGGVIQDSASSATLCAMLAARERATGFACSLQGLRAPLRAYASTQAHSSVEKAAAIAGIGRSGLCAVDTDPMLRMNPDLLAAAIARDRKQGKEPFFVCATVGTTSSLAVDPVRAIGELCRSEGLWLHVDAAMAGTAALCPEYRYLNDGLEFADSYCVNPHKWMLTNFDCDCFFVADRAPLLSALSVLPEYLRNQASESGAVIDYRDWQIPLGRRFRALKLWFVIHHYGIRGLQCQVRKHIALAKEFAGWVHDATDFELAAPTTLNLVCFRHRGGDAVNRRLLDELNGSGKVYLSHTVIDDRLTLRLCVGQPRTEQHHVRAAWELICSMAP